jgi:CarD family transcriptional regulator
MEISVVPVCSGFGEISSFWPWGKVVEMQFSVGDKVVHPAHGPGVITGVVHKQMVEGFEEYYVLRMLRPEMKMFVPVCMVSELGIRAAMSPSDVDRMLRILRRTPEELPDDHRERRSCLQDKLVSGSVRQVAEAVRDLAWRERCDHLTGTDERLLGEGIELLAREMALVTGRPDNDAKEAITGVLADGMVSNAAPDGEKLTPSPVQPAPQSGSTRMGSLRHRIIKSLSERTN